MAYLNIAAIRPCTEAEGPGKRFAIWCQGCLRRCIGCCNPHMQPIEHRTLVSVDNLFELIKKHNQIDKIEGISLIGGEPVLQAEGASFLAEKCQEDGISVILFTGYKYEDLITSKDGNIIRLLNNVDIIIDGEYKQNEIDTERDWVGSCNQNVIYLSERYPKGIEYKKRVHSTEICITNNKLTINGWPII